MSDVPVTFSGRTIFADGKNTDLEYPILDAFGLKDKVIVLFHPDAYTEKFGQFPNLVAVTFDGERVWTAELPTHQSGDRYYKIASRSPLVVYSIYSFECEIDESTGKIKKGIFYK